MISTQPRSSVSHIKKVYENKVCSLENVYKLIKSNYRIIIGNSAACPQVFINNLPKYAKPLELKNIEIVHSRIGGSLEYLKPEYKSNFFHNAFVIGLNSRQPMIEGRADFVPNILHYIPNLMEDNLLKPDVTVLHLSRPDYEGWCSYGTCAIYLPAAVKRSQLVIGEINEQMPKTYGSRINIQDLDCIIEVSYPLHELVWSEETTEVEGKIGKYVAELIEDGSTIQIGLGAIPEAVIEALTGKKDLSVFTEMLGKGIVDLVEKGCVTGSGNTLNPGKIICTFIEGNKRLYDFVHENPMIEVHPTEYVNDPYTIAKNRKMIAINSAVEIDITGQICAESIGTRQISGTGGQLDFALGALHSEGGKFIIAMPSNARGGKVSKIVARLSYGSIVTTPRSLADYVVTEYGIASLRGKNLRQRAKALIKIAHPNFRSLLEEEGKKREDIYFE
jgi:4-hydroxybutyrate CoA-transferase